MSLNLTGGTNVRIWDLFSFCKLTLSLWQESQDYDCCFWSLFVLYVMLSHGNVRLGAHASDVPVPVHCRTCSRPTPSTQLPQKLQLLAWPLQSSVPFHGPGPAWRPVLPTALGPSSASLTAPAVTLLTAQRCAQAVKSYYGSDETSRIDWPIPEVCCRAAVVPGSVLHAPHAPSWGKCKRIASFLITRALAPAFDHLIVSSSGRVAEMRHQEEPQAKPCRSIMTFTHDPAHTLPTQVRPRTARPVGLGHGTHGGDACEPGLAPFGWQRLALQIYKLAMPAGAEPGETCAVFVTHNRSSKLGVTASTLFQMRLFTCLTYFNKMMPRN